MVLICSKGIKVLKQYPSLVHRIKEARFSSEFITCQVPNLIATINFIGRGKVIESTGVFFLLQFDR